MKTIFGLLITLTFVATGFAQDEKAKKILDDISVKTKAYETMVFEFTVVLTTPDDDEPYTQTGKVYVKGDKYFLTLTEQDIYCDGTTITTYLKEDNECYTRPVPDGTTDEIVSPTQLLTVWEEGYKYKYIQETTYADRPAHEIHLYPKDPSKSKFHTIILKIDVERNEIVFFMVKAKDGTNTKYKISKFEKNVEIGDSKFIFDRAKHPGVVCQEE